MSRPKTKFKFAMLQNGKHWDVVLWHPNAAKWKQHWVGLTKERAVEELAWLERAGHGVEWPKGEKCARRH